MILTDGQPIHQINHAVDKPTIAAHSQPEFEGVVVKSRFLKLPGTSPSWC